MAKPTQTGHITIVSVSSDTIRIKLEAISGATSYQVAYRPINSASAQMMTTYGLTCIISGLQSNTTYLINYRGVNSDGFGPFMSTAVQVDVGEPEPEPPTFIPFDWTYAGLNSVGSPVSGITKRPGYGIYVTAAEWNELAGLIYEVTGKRVSTVSTGQSISASVVNTMARALGVATVSRGDVIKASFFNALRSAYNALG